MYSKYYANNRLWTIYPGAVAESLNMHTLELRRVNLLNESSREANSRSIFTQFKHLDAHGGSGSAISDPVVDISTLLAMVCAVIRNLIVIADVDCRILA